MQINQQCQGCIKHNVPISIVTFYDLYNETRPIPIPLESSWSVLGSSSSGQ